MKTILLPMVDDESIETSLAAAHFLARRFNGHIEGLFVRAAPPTVPRATIPGHFLKQYHEYWDESAENARARFTAFMGDRGVPFREIAVKSQEPTAWWTELEGERGPAVGSYGRLFELIIAGRTPPEPLDEWAALCEAALFDSGRPVLVPGPVPLEAFGETVAIAWNGSTETARTIALAMPILSTAKQVTVLSVTGASGGMVPGPTGSQVAAYLARSGVDAEARDVAAKGRSPGTAILEEAADIGADLLLKGAYTHNRLRQMIFGGTTREILARAEVPVFIAH